MPVGRGEASPLLIAFKEPTVMARVDLVLLHPPTIYDFRKRAVLLGPISDVVPSTPIFEMYPLGFATIAEYLERHDLRARIINLALRMLKDPAFDAEGLVASLHPLAFGIDLHWLAHAQGALEVAKVVKRHHPTTPVILGGFSASYYHQELAERPEVDYVVRGDSTEEPLRLLLEALSSGGDLASIPNLTWRDQKGQVRVNPLTYLPPDLDAFVWDYSEMVKSVARHRDLVSQVPFHDWLEYPVMAALTCRGCTRNCVTCGGSAYASRFLFGRLRPAYRQPEGLAEDMRRIRRFSRGPIMLLGDIRQGGMEQAHRFLQSMRGFKGRVLAELFCPASRDFLEEMAQAFPQFALEISLESHDPEVRRAFGKDYSNQEVEETIKHALAVGCQRLDIFFMIGLPKQTFGSVMDTIEYCEELLNRFGDGRLHPFISPMAPTLDPGSLAFEHPDKHGYCLFYRTLEEHRQAFLSPSWKYVLNYQTAWMTRDEIVESTYEALLRLARLKAAHGLIAQGELRATEERMVKSRELKRKIDGLLLLGDVEKRERLLWELKPHLDAVNFSRPPEDRELALPVDGGRWNLLWAAWLVAQDRWAGLKRGLRRLLG